MQIFIDNELSELSYDAGLSLEQILVLHEQKLKEDDPDAILTVHIDQKDILDHDFEELKALDVSEVGRVDFYCSNKYDLVKSGLAQALIKLDDLKEDVELICQDIHSNLRQKALTGISEFSQSLISVVQIIIHTSHIYDISLKEFVVKGRAVEDFSEELSQFLTETKQAIEKDDLVSLGDVLEYEIIPQLAELKSVVQAISEIAENGPVPAE